MDSVASTADRAAAAHLGGDYTSAVELYLAARALWDSTACPHGYAYARTSLLLAMCYNELADSASALPYVEHARALAAALVERDDGTQLIAALRTDCEEARGVALSQLGRLDEAATAHELALALAEGAGDAVRIVDSLINIAYTCRGRHFNLKGGLLSLQRAELLCTRDAMSVEDVLERQARITHARGCLLGVLARNSDAIPIWK